MKLIPIIISFFIISLNLVAKTFNSEDVLIQLDEVINNKANYESIKQKRISDYRLLLNNSVDDMSRLRAYRKLFYEYRTYNVDSAMHFALIRLKIAEKLNIPDSISSALMNKADGLKGLGKYVEAKSILNSIKKNDFIKNSPYYYHLNHSITLSMFNNSYDKEEKKQLNNLLLRYRDTINNVNQISSIGYIINNAEMLKLKNQYKKALVIMLEFYSKYPEKVNSNATFLCCLSDVYKNLNDIDRQKYYLTLGAIVDKKACGKSYTSLQNLAILLNKEGDTERAYRYITCAMQDIISSNAKSRLNQVAEFMPIITSAYTEQQTEESRRRNIFISSILFLAFLLGITLLILYKRNLKLRSMKIILDTKNKELNFLNENLKIVNHKLTESNKIKEEYIAQLFNLCSEYIDNMEKFRLNISRKIKTGQTKEVEDLLKYSVTSKYMKDFFRNFDKIFLDLFPNFIDSFNQLLNISERIYPKEGELLSPELRIYALVRLGINDSTKIASFLHYSPQTVYNYRQKVRNKTTFLKEKFIDLVQNL